MATNVDNCAHNVQKDMRSFKTEQFPVQTPRAFLLPCTNMKNYPRCPGRNGKGGDAQWSDGGETKNKRKSNKVFCEAWWELGGGGRPNRSGGTENHKGQKLSNWTVACSRNKNHIPPRRRRLGNLTPLSIRLHRRRPAKNHPLSPLGITSSYYHGAALSYIFMPPSPAPSENNHRPRSQPPTPIPRPAR
ncbi:hypothetical protein PR048_007932 [Dryococelus australis]|uniref:Uncharacterized protein n=1 Tax=Dryococelus australis TaxID=614101 RepID=A0ABQ9HW04_9NEOP|nr:hypothetical protein PR048_007932 [Dryococelus australis]